jgi:hypothetical protein
VGKAVKLLKHVVAVRAKVFRNGHASRLNLQRAFAKSDADNEAQL